VFALIITFWETIRQNINGNGGMELELCTSVRMLAKPQSQMILVHSELPEVTFVTLKRMDIAMQFYKLSAKKLKLKQTQLLLLLIAMPNVLFIGL